MVNVKSFSRFNSNEDSPFDEFPNPMDSIGSIEHQSEIPIKAVDGSELNVVKQLDNEAKTVLIHNYDL